MGQNNNIEMKEKLDKFASILEKFGLDIITKMGQTNLNIKMLTDKINQLSEATIDVKALLPQLNNVIENQKILETELDLIRTLIQRSDISFRSKEMESEPIKRDTSATDKKQSIIEQFNALVKFLNENDDPKPVIIVPFPLLLIQLACAKIYPLFSNFIPIKGVMNNEGMKL